MILTVTANPCVDKTVFIDTLEVGTFMRSDRCTCVAGGKGNNVARAVKTMGHAAKAMVIVGGHSGEHVVDMLTNDDEVACEPVWVASPTRTITTVLEESIHRQTAFFEPGSRVTDDEFEHIVFTFTNAVSSADIVAFCGTVPDPSIQSLYERLIPIAKESGALTILDSHGPEFALGLEMQPFMVKPNIAETEELVGYKLDSDAAKKRAIQFFHDKGIELVVLSLGKGGALVSQGKTQLHVAPPTIKEVNPVGSGDALVAGFAIGLLNNMPLEKTAKLACAMGAANASSWDIGHFTQEEVASLLDGVTVKT